MQANLVIAFPGLLLRPAAFPGTLLRLIAFPVALLHLVAVLLQQLSKKVIRHSVFFSKDLNFA